MKMRTLAHLQKIKTKGLKSFLPHKVRIAVGLGSCGIAAGAEGVYNVFHEEAKKNTLDMSITKTGCLGFCGEEPLVNVSRPRTPLVIYRQVTEDDARAIVSQIVGNKLYDKKVFCKIEEMENFIQPEGIKYGTGYADIPHFYEVLFTKSRKRSF